MSLSRHRINFLAAALIIGSCSGAVMTGCRAAESQTDTEADVTNMQTVEDAYLGLSSGPLAQAIIADLPDGVVMQADDVTVRREEVDAFIEQRTTTADEKAALQAEAFFVLEQLAAEPLLEREAKQWAAEQEGDPGEAVIDAHLQHIAEQVTVSDDDVRAYFEDNEAMFGGASYEQFAEQLRTMVLREKQQDAITGHIDGLSERNAVTVDRAFIAEAAAKALDNPLDEARRSGKPTFADFGAEGCQACDMMAPIIEELDAELGEQVNVVLVQVREEQYLSARYGIRSIPVQFVYDAEGREVFDHVGFLSKEAILEQLSAVGVE